MNRTRDRKRDSIIRVYVGGPLTQGKGSPILSNVRLALWAAEHIMRLGALPFVPHLNTFWEMMIPHHEDFWTGWDIGWLLTCDALYRFPGVSPMADREMEIAKMCGIPVFTEMNELRKFIDGRKGITDNTAEIRDTDINGVP